MNSSIDICSLCSCTSESLIKTERKDTNSSILQQMQFVLPENDYLKTKAQFHVCEICLSSLNAFHAFRKQYIENIAKIRKQLSEIHEEPKLENKKETSKSEFMDNSKLKTTKRNINKKEVVSRNSKNSRHKTYECSVCGISVPYKSDLTKHMIVVHDTKYKCEQCDSGFRYKYNLLKHVRAKHNKESDDFKCTICHKKFVTQANFEKHIAIHNVNSCSYCSKQFKWNYLLQNHINVLHHGIKKYKCTICNKEFGYVTSMNKHMKVHKS